MSEGISAKRSERQEHFQRIILHPSESEFCVKGDKLLIRRIHRHPDIPVLPAFSIYALIGDRGIIGLALIGLAAAIAGRR